MGRSMRGLGQRNSILVVHLCQRSSKNVYNALERPGSAGRACALSDDLPCDGRHAPHALVLGLGCEQNAPLARRHRRALHGLLATPFLSRSSTACSAQPPIRDRPRMERPPRADNPARPPRPCLSELKLRNRSVDRTNQKECTRAAACRAGRCWWAVGAGTLPPRLGNGAELIARRGGASDRSRGDCDHPYKRSAPASAAGQPFQQGAGDTVISAPPASSAAAALWISAQR